MEKKNNNTLFLTQMAMLTVIEIIFCFYLGSIPINAGIVMTLAHLPAVVAALILGKRAGLWMGAVMGAASLYIWTFIIPAMPGAFAFTPWSADGNGNFWSAVVSIVPRVIFPVVIAVLHDKLKTKWNKYIAAGVAAGIGYFVHSFLVLTTIYLAFAGNEGIGTSYIYFILGLASLNFLYEVVLAIIVGVASVSRIGIRKQSKN